MAQGAAAPCRLSLVSLNVQRARYVLIDGSKASGADRFLVHGLTYQSAKVGTPQKTSDPRNTDLDPF